MSNYNDTENNYNENENRSYRYDINRYRSRYGHKYTKYTTCISKCIKQHLSNMWSSANEKISLSWKKALLVKKKACNT